MADYYELIEPWEPELIGVKDGLGQATVSENGFKNKKFYKEFIRVFANPNYFSFEDAMSVQFELECVKMRRGAILTDFISFSPMSYCLVSNKLFTILRKYNLGKHRFFKAIIEDLNGKLIEGYFFFYLEVLDWHIIDFPHCEFVKGNSHDGYSDVSIKTKDEFLRDRFVQLKKISISGMPQNDDIFSIRLPVGKLISSRLHQELSSLSITGIKFRKIEVSFTEESFKHR